MFFHSLCNTFPVFTLAFWPLAITSEWKVIIPFSPGSFICFFVIICVVSRDKNYTFPDTILWCWTLLYRTKKTQRMCPLAIEHLCDYFLYYGLLWLNVLHETFRANWSHLNGPFSLRGNEVAWKIKKGRKTLIKEGTFKGLNIDLSSSSFLYSSSWSRLSGFLNNSVKPGGGVTLNKQEPLWAMLQLFNVRIKDTWC